MSSVTIQVDLEALKRWHESEEFKEQKRKEKELHNKLDGKEFEINGYIVACDGSLIRTETIVDNIKIASSAFLYYNNKEIGYHIHYPTRTVNYGNIKNIPKKFQEDFAKMTDALNSLRVFD